MVVVVRRGLAFGDFGSDDLLYFGLGEDMSFRLRGTEAGYGAGEMGTAATGSRRGLDRNGAGVVDRG